MATPRKANPITPVPPRICKLTPEIADRFIMLLKRGNWISVICQACDIEERTYYGWLEKGVEQPDSPFSQFRERVLEATSDAEFAAVEAWNCAFKNDWKAASKFLAIRHRQRWGEGASAAAEAAKSDEPIDYTKYQSDPVAFAEEILGITLWSKQKDILNALLKHKRVMVESANAVGKTVVASVAALWFYICFPKGIGLVTAPKFDQIKDITFKEIRKYYGTCGNPAHLKPCNPEIQESPEHVLRGTTASDATAFQGHHASDMLIVFEEATAISGEFWEAASGMLAGGQNTYFLAILNPTDPGSTAFQERQSGRWHVIGISALEHPNIIAELSGEEPPYPSAVRLAQLRDNLAQWATVVTEADRQPLDFEWDGTLYRPKPEAEARVLGRYPSQASTAIFSTTSFDLARTSTLQFAQEPIEIGCDVARFGNDLTAIHVRKGPVSLEHVTFHGQSTAWSAATIKELAIKWCKHFSTEECKIDPKKVECKIDDAGVGGGVVDQAGEFNFVGVNSGSSPIDSDFPNVRSELIFNLATMLDKGMVSFAKLNPTTVDEIQRQAVSITYKLDAKGRRVAEPKESIKRRIKRSPDDADAVALAYYRPMREVEFW